MAEIIWNKLRLAPIGIYTGLMPQIIQLYRILMDVRI